MKYKKSEIIDHKYSTKEIRTVIFDFIANENLSRLQGM